MSYLSNSSISLDLRTAAANAALAYVEAIAHRSSMHSLVLNTSTCDAAYEGIRERYEMADDAVEDAQMVMDDAAAAIAKPFPL